MRKLENSLSLVWMGAAGFYISDKDNGFYIDPFVSRISMSNFILGKFGKKMKIKKEQVNNWIKKTNGEKADAVLVTHAHYDHAADAPFFCKKIDAKLIGSESTANIGRGAGLKEDKIKIMDYNDSVNIGKFKITFFKGDHIKLPLIGIPCKGKIKKPLVPPVSPHKYKSGKIYSLFIEHPNSNIMHHTSAHTKNISFNGFEANIFLLGIVEGNDYEEYLKNTLDVTKSKKLIPMHYDDFFVPLERKMKILPRVNLSRLIQTSLNHNPEINLEFIKPGKRYNLN